MICSLRWEEALQGRMQKRSKHFFDASWIVSDLLSFRRTLPPAFSPSFYMNRLHGGRVLKYECLYISIKESFK